MKAINNTGGGNGRGHVIKDASGTDLTQRSSLQFKGSLLATDDSTNSKTIVDDSAYEISWNDWNAMSAAEQDAFCELHPKVDILDPPSVDGTISAELIKKLWENPSPSSNFSQQQITLSSSDYDFLLWVYRTVKNADVTKSEVSTKGYGVLLDATVSNSSSNLRTRSIGYMNDLNFWVDQNYTSTTTVDNGCNIPIAIYGIKSTINLKLSAIASDVNTAADHCMMSDGVTSVEDKIDELNEEFAMQGADVLCQSSASSWTRVALSESLSKYNWVGIAILTTTGNVVSIATIPTAFFKTQNTNTKAIRTVLPTGGSNLVTTANFYYDDDTHVYAIFNPDSTPTDKTATLIGFR